MWRYSTSLKKKSENTKVKSCRFSLVLQKSVSAHASPFPNPGSTGTNPKPCQTLELCNCLIETRLYLQGLFSTEVPLVPWLLQSLIPCSCVHCLRLSLLCRSWSQNTSLTTGLSQEGFPVSHPTKSVVVSDKKSPKENPKEKKKWWLRAALGTCAHNNSKELRAVRQD